MVLKPGSAFEWQGKAVEYLDAWPHSWSLSFNGTSVQDLDGISVFLQVVVMH